MSAMPSPDKNEPSKITGSRVVGGNYTRHEQREFTWSAAQYGRQKYRLFCKTRPPVSFVMSKFQKHTVPLCKPTKNKEFCGGLWCGVGCTALFPSVARPKHLSHGIQFYECILFVHLWELYEQNSQEKHLKLTKTRSLRSRHQTSWWHSSARRISLIGSHTATQETN